MDTDFCIHGSIESKANRIWYTSLGLCKAQRHHHRVQCFASNNNCDYYTGAKFDHISMCFLRLEIRKGPRESIIHLRGDRLTPV